MNEVEIEQNRQKLLQLRSELREMERTYHDNSAPVELDQARVGRLSRMDAMQSQQMALETTRRRQDQILQIDAALRRIESGEYGYCLECEEEIDIRRLSINPANKHCIKCADNN